MLPKRLPPEADPSSMAQAAVKRAIRAWVEFSGSEAPRRIKTMLPPRYTGKSVVLGLGPVGPGGIRVVAKELLARAAKLEKTVYEEILPRLSVSGPELIGMVESVDPGRVWLFLEEVDGPAFDKRDAAHVAIASRWLARLHSETLNGDEGLLPERHPAHYEALAKRTRSELGEVSENRELTSTQTELLGRLAGHVGRLLASFDSVADVYTALPRVVVHGDFKWRNMAFSSTVGLQDLYVFDWSEAHVGPTAIDTWWVDGGYTIGMREAGVKLDSRQTVDSRRLSTILRTLSSVAWEIPSLRFEWVAKPMSRMSRYEGQLSSALVETPWIR